MPLNCSVCIHPQQSAIEDELRRGTPLRHIVAQFGTSTGTLRRHKEHMVTEVAAVDNTVELPATTAAKTYAQELSELKERAYRCMELAEQADNHAAMVAWTREIRGIMELYFKIGVAQKEIELAKHSDVSPEIMRLVDEVIGE